MKRASSTGPFAVINDGTVLVAPSSVASATCGFGIGFCGLVGPGLAPPIVGWAWHWAQLLPLKVGPRPDPSSPAMAPETESTSWKRSWACVKNVCSLEFSVEKKLPAAGG